MSKIRANVDRELRGANDPALTQREWNLFENVYRQEIQRWSLAFFAERVRQHRQAHRLENDPSGGALTIRPRGGVATELRANLIAEQVAKVATKVVEKFRETHLGGQLLAPRDVENYLVVEKWLAARGAGSNMVALPVTIHEHPMRSALRGGSVQFSLAPEAAKARPHWFSVSRLTIDYRSTSGAMRFIDITYGSVLHSLLVLASELGERFTWNQADAVRFVLSGETPHVYHLSMEAKPREITSLSRISITVDPAVRPSDLARHYESLRNGLLTAERLGKRLPRQTKPTSDRTIALARFISEGNANGTIRQQLAAFNRAHPKKLQYPSDQPQRFHRDKKRATEYLRLLTESGFSSRAVAALGR